MHGLMNLLERKNSSFLVFSALNGNGWFHRCRLIFNKSINLTVGLQKNFRRQLNSDPSFSDTDE